MSTNLATCVDQIWTHILVQIFLVEIFLGKISLSVSQKNFRIIFPLTLLNNENGALRKNETPEGTHALCFLKRQTFKDEKIHAQRRSKSALQPHYKNLSGALRAHI
jgi:hypothetical protein